MSKNFVPSYDEHKLLAAIAEKVFAIQYIANGDLKSALNDIYGKREAILMLSVAMSEMFERLRKSNPIYNDFFGKEIIKRIADQRNIIAHNYHKSMPNRAKSVLQHILPIVSKVLNEKFHNSLNLGFAIYKNNIAYKEENAKKQELKHYANKHNTQNLENGLKM